MLVGVVQAFAATEVAPGVWQLGSIQDPAIAESSGVASARNRALFWTHNDSGAEQLFAVSTNGETVATWEVRDINPDNWEDLSKSGRNLFIADTGNDALNRDNVFVFRVPEPSTARSGEVRPTRTWRLSYADEPFDGESLFIRAPFGYLIDRNGSGEGTQVYRFRMNRGVDVVLEPQFRLNVGGSVVTGTAVSPDKRRLAVITDSGAYLFFFPKPFPISGLLEPLLFVPYASSTTEGCTFTRNGLLVTGEAREILLFTAEPFREKWRAPRN